MTAADERDIDWVLVTQDYLEHHHTPQAVRSFLLPLLSAHPLDLTEAIDPELGAAHKQDLCQLMLLAIRHALADHALTDAEMNSLRQVARLFRIEEGDLLVHYPGEVAELLAKEMERLLMDQSIDPAEAVHKAKLQVLFGCGYDQFVTLTAPQVERVILELVGELEATQDQPGALQRFLKRVSALDTIYELNAERWGWPSGGSLYLLMNPAMPGLIKVGRTTRGTEERALELTSATGVPLPFVLIYEVAVPNAAAAESYVHSRLETLGYRVSGNREFFTAPPTLAIQLMMESKRTLN